jgi:deoxyadenosine/deoxycytidine kinase
MSASAPFIVVTGNIAAGKSTLVQRLAAELGLAAYPERIQENPFFGAPQHRALESEMWFLADSVAVHRTIQRDGQGGIQERSVYEHVPVFARARARCGWLGPDELQLVEQLAQLLYEGLRPPDLLVYAQADPAAIAARIAARGRPGEQLIDSSYLCLLSELYDEFVDSWRLSRVYRLDTTHVDVRNDEGFRLARRGILEVLP